jgi:hypothetical protein
MPRKEGTSTTRLDEAADRYSSAVDVLETVEALADCVGVEDDVEAMWRRAERLVHHARMAYVREMLRAGLIQRV